MDSLSENIIQRVYDYTGHKSIFEFVLFQAYESELIKSYFVDTYGFTLTNVSRIKTMNNCYLYSCSVRTNLNEPDNKISIYLDNILQQYKTWIDANLLMVNPNYPYNLICLITGSDTTLELSGKIPDNLKHKLKISDQYTVQENYKDDKTELRLIPN